MSHHHRHKDYEHLHHHHHHHHKKRKHHEPLPPPPSRWIKGLAAVVLLGAIAAIGYAISTPFTKSSSPPGAEFPLLPTSGRYWVDPNQEGSSPWDVINGLISTSYGNLGNWPTLASTIVSRGGGLSIYASQVGTMQSSTLLALRAAGIPVMVETTGMTQCISGTEIGQVEMYGAQPEVWC